MFRHNNKLSTAEWNQLCNKFLSELTQSVTNDRGGAKKMSEALGIEKQRISRMRSPKATGNKVTWIRLVFYKMGISDIQAKKILSNPNIAFNKGLEAHLSPIDELYGSLRRIYSDNELAGWFKLLLSKRKIENELSISVTVKKKTSVKKVMTKRKKKTKS